MARRRRQRKSPFKVKVVLVAAYKLATIGPADPVWRGGLMAAADAAQFYRLFPPSDATDETIAKIEALLLSGSTGIAVKTMPRAAAPLPAVDTSDDPFDLDDAPEAGDLRSAVEAALKSAKGLSDAGAAARCVEKALSEAGL